MRRSPSSDFRPATAAGRDGRLFVAARLVPGLVPGLVSGLVSGLVAGLAAAVSPALAEEARPEIPVAVVQYFDDGTITLTAPSSPDRLEVERRLFSLRTTYGRRFEASGTTLVAIAGYDLALSSSRQGSTAWRTDSYHFPHLEAILLQKLRGPWGLMFYGAGGVASDFAGFGSADLRYTGGMGLTYSPSSDLRIGVGAVVTNMADLDAPVLPLLDVSYRSGRTKLRLSVPNELSAWFSPTPAIDVGLAVRKLSLRYNLHARDRIADEYGTLDLTFGPSLRAYLRRNLSLQGQGGYAVRRFRLRRDDQDALEHLSGGWFVSLSLGYVR